MTTAPHIRTLPNGLTLDEARTQAAKAPGYSYGQYPKAPGGASPLKEPTRIVELPCAEWHEWCE